MLRGNTMLLLLAVSVRSAQALVLVAARPGLRTTALKMTEVESDRFYFADPRPLFKAFFGKEKVQPSIYTGLDASDRAAPDAGPDVTPVTDELVFEATIAALKGEDLANILLSTRGADESQRMLMDALKVVRGVRFETSGASQWRNAMSWRPSKGSSFFKSSSKDATTSKPKFYSGM